MNNQLVNSQRALVKANQQLKQALHEIQSANDRIAALELDDLTGLYRPTAFYQKVEQRLAAEPDRPYEMLALNIAHFALINEMFGRKASRQLLRELALWLCGQDAKGEGLFTRATLDLFYVFMPEESGFHTKLCEALPRFFEVYPLPVHLFGRLGVCFGMGPDTKAETLCDRAHLALDTVQEQDNPRLAFYQESLHEELLLEHRILDSVPAALAEGQFQLYLQPKVEMRTRRQIGAEALIRWVHPELGFLSPGVFIPLLERENLIYAVDQYIWEEACKFIAARRAKGLPSLPVSVNLARGDLYQPDLVQVLERMTARNAVSPEELRLEIIERMYTDDTEKLNVVLGQLRARGFTIEMDDFGVGASSLSMAAEMPVDVLKLDRSFVTTCTENPRQEKVVQFIIELARTLQMRLIAEGVETEEQAALLLRLGCHYAQGYLYGKPQPAAQFLEPQTEP